MGVERFRSAEEMNAAPAKGNLGDGFDRFIRQCARFRRIAPLELPSGVFRFRSLAEAQAARDHIAELNAARLRNRNSRPPGSEK